MKAQQHGTAVSSRSLPRVCRGVSLHSRLGVAAATPGLAASATTPIPHSGQPTRTPPRLVPSAPFTPPFLRPPPRAKTMQCPAQGATGASSSISVSQYLGRGPYTVSPPVQLKFLVGPGRSGAVDCSLRVFLPKGGQQQLQQQEASPPRPPLLVLSSGFLLHSSMYGSYAMDLASWGLAVVLYDLPELVDDVTMVSALGSVLDACTSDPRVGPYIDSRAILLAGHSRGGKLSVLTAASDPRVKGLALLDPVDVTSMTPTGPGYPSALPAMRVACSPPRSCPALVVGAARNTGVIPEAANYRRFVASCPGPCWFLELTDAGHLQFLDAKVDLLSAFVESGPTPDETVRQVSKAALLAWALELAVPLARGETVDGSQVLERLQQTAALLERQASLSWSFKAYDALGGPASSGAGRTSGGGSYASTSASITSSTNSSYSASSSSRSTAGSSGVAAGGARFRGDTQGTRADIRANWGSDTSSSSASSSTAAAGAAHTATPGGGAGRSGALWSYEELMRMRARDLKAILMDHGVNCSDCFEKEHLARRIMDRC